MKNIVAFAHALADETRWRILHLVFDEPLCVCELADILSMPQSSVSSHVQVIKKARLLDSEKCEKWIYYRVAENHRHLLRILGEFFDLSPEGDLALKRDAERAAKRLAERDTSCCPLPKGLAKLQPLAASRRPRSTTTPAAS